MTLGTPCLFSNFNLLHTNFGMKNSIPHTGNFKDIRIQQRSEVMAFGQVGWEKFYGELSSFLTSCDRQEGNIRYHSTVTSFLHA